MSVNLDPRPGDPFPVTTHLLQKITELERENAALLQVLQGFAKSKEVPGVTIAEIAEYAKRAIDAARKEQP